MKIQIESTSAITEINGVAVRAWTGVTESGIPCIVFVHRIAVHKTAYAGDFERELQEQNPPRPVSFDEVLRQHAPGEPMPTGDVPAEYQQ